MTISKDYAILSEDKKTVLLPDDVRKLLEGFDRLVVLVEDDSIILKKAYPRRTLEELVACEKAPLSEGEMNRLVHEIRK